MNLEQLKKSDDIIFESVTGSHAYNLALPTSDKDIRGIFCIPKEDRISILPKIYEVGDDKQDVKFYELEKFFHLAIDCNPNIVELMFIPEDYIIKINDIGKELMKNRHLFISTKAYFTHSGYAFAQIKKAKGENKWVNNPKDKEPPKKEDFCWVIEDSKILVDSDIIFPCRPVELNKTGITLSEYHVAALEHVSNTYRMYFYGNAAKGVFRNGMLVCESIPKEAEIERFSGLLIYNQHEYEKAMVDWKNYWNWIKNRNPNRWKLQEDGLLDHDCYLNTETEFLTDKGWKFFDDITNEKLATIDTNHNIIFQLPTTRICKKYSGLIYTYENRYTRFSVTSNHKLYVSDCHRCDNNNFSTQYIKDNSNWHLETVDEFFKGYKSYKNIIIALNNNKKDYNISDDLIKLIGLYLSEGSIAFNRKHIPMAIYISQLVGGKAERFINDLHSFNIKKTSCVRKNRVKYTIENTFRIQDRELANKFLVDFGHGCKNKKIPSYVYLFSLRQTLLLFEAMMSGDGHKHIKGHQVYYSTSQRLIKDLATLLFINGFATQIYLYPKSTSQLFFSKERKQYITINKTFNKNREFTWKQRFVTNSNIVCFSIPNGILITRNKNKIAVQGNSKNMMHCMRLLISGQNILTTGEPKVRFEGDEQKYLMDIRNGNIKYDDIIVEVDKRMIDLETLYKTSKLPHHVDIHKINELYKQLCSMKM